MKKSFDKMSDEEKSALNRKVQFRGIYMEQMINVEELIDRILMKFFNAHKNNSINDFMKYFQLPDLDVSKKLNYLFMIIKIDISESALYSPIQAVLQKLMQLRNVVAHNPFGANDLVSIPFIRPDYEMNITKGVDNRTFDGYERIVLVTNKAIQEILGQFDIALFVLYRLDELYLKRNSKNIISKTNDICRKVIEGNSYLLKNSLNKNDKNKNPPLELLGVFTVNLKSSQA